MYLQEIMAVALSWEHHLRPNPESDIAVNWDRREPAAELTVRNR